MTTWQMLWVVPRSTSSHWGSENCEDQLVPVLPSTALDAGVPALSVEEAVAGLVQRQIRTGVTRRRRCGRAPNAGTDNAASNNVSTTNKAARGRAQPITHVLSKAWGEQTKEEAPSGLKVAQLLPAVNTNAVP